LFDIGNMGLESVVSPQIIRMMEVYPRGSQVPIEFMTMNGCGSLVIWTGPRAPRMPPP
jgi:hypothetical protein